MNDKDKNDLKTKEQDYQNDQYLILKKLYGLFKSDYAKFTSLFIAAITIGVWLIRGMWYFYTLGKFSVFKIDICYIEPTKDSVIYQIIQVIVCFIILAFFNKTFYLLIKEKDFSKFHWKKIIIIFILYLSELIILFGGIIFFYNYNVVKVLEEFIEYPRYIFDVFILLTLLFILFNSFGIAFSIKEKILNKEKNRLQTFIFIKDMFNFKNIENIEKALKMILTLICIIAFELGWVFFIGIYSTSIKKDYKIISESVEYHQDNNDIYTINDDEKQLSWYIYIITFENQEKYILSRLYREEDNIKIDYKYQKVIDKDNVETLYLDNIFQRNKK